MDVLSFHVRNPYFTSSVVISSGMGVVTLTESGIAKDVKNSRRVSSSPCQSAGIVPPRISAASRERLENVSRSCIFPFPHGEAAAARNEFLLYFSRLCSMLALSSKVSHTMSFSSVVASNAWKSSGSAGLFRCLGTKTVRKLLFSCGLVTCRIF